METAKIMNTIVLQKMVDKLCTEKDAAVHSAANFIKENIKQRQEILKLTARIAELEEAQRMRVVADAELPDLFADVIIIPEGGELFDIGFRAELIFIGKEKDYEYEDVYGWFPIPTIPKLPAPPEVQE